MGCCSGAATQPGHWERFKLWLWPRVSWRRSGLYYLKRILRLSGTPYAIAMGAAVGAAVAFTPFIGLHFVITFAIAWLLRGNMIAGAIAQPRSAIRSPIRFIWAGTYQLGQLILRQESRTVRRRSSAMSSCTSRWDELWPSIEPMTVGSIPLGLAVGCIVYLHCLQSGFGLPERRAASASPERRPHGERAG